MRSGLSVAAWRSSRRCETSAESTTREKLTAVAVRTRLPIRTSMTEGIAERVTRHAYVAQVKIAAEMRTARNGTMSDLLRPLAMQSVNRESVAVTTSCMQSHMRVIGGQVLVTVRQV